MCTHTRTHLVQQIFCYWWIYWLYYF